MSSIQKKLQRVVSDLPPTPMGRIITLGAGARRRERFLWTALTTVSFALIALLAGVAWLLNNGTLVIMAKTAAPTVVVVKPPSVSPAKNGTATALKNTPKVSVQTVPATMAPTPANGKYEDSVVPAEKSAASSEAPLVAAKPALPAAASPVVSPPPAPIVKAQAPKPVASMVQAPAAAVAALPPKAAALVIAPTPALVAPSKVAPTPVVVAAATPIAPPPVLTPAPPPKPAPVMHSQPPAPVAKVVPKAAAQNVANSTAPSSPALDEAHSMLERGNYAGALAIYDRLLDRNPRNIAALSGKAEALQRTEQYEAAAEINRQIRKLHPND